MSRRHRNSKEEQTKIVTDQELFFKEAKTISKKYGFTSNEAFFCSLLSIKRRSKCYVENSIKNGSIGKTELNILRSVGFTSIKEASIFRFPDTPKKPEKLETIPLCELAITEAEEIHLNSDSERILERLDQINSNIEKLIKVIESK